MNSPVFVSVNLHNIDELEDRRRTQPHILNGSVYPDDPDFLRPPLNLDDLIAFPWATDAITQLGEIAKESNAHIDAVKRIKLEDDELLWVRVDVLGPKSMYPASTARCLVASLQKALGHLGDRAFFTGPEIDIQKISAVDLLAIVAKAHQAEKAPEARAAAAEPVLE